MTLDEMGKKMEFILEMYGMDPVAGRKRMNELIETFRDTIPKKVELCAGIQQPQCRMKPISPEPRLSESHTRKGSCWGPRGE